MCDEIILRKVFADVARYESVCHADFGRIRIAGVKTEVRNGFVIGKSSRSLTVSKIVHDDGS